MRPSFQQAKQRLGFQQRSSLNYSLPNNQRMLFNARPSTNFGQSPRGNNRPTTNDPAICINCDGKRHKRQLCLANNVTCFFVWQTKPFSVSLSICSPLGAMPIRRESNGHSIDNRNTIDVKVFNRNVVALLDTGASRSCISKTFADQLWINILPIENNDKFLNVTGS